MVGERVREREASLPYYNSSFFLFLSPTENKIKMAAIRAINIIVVQCGKKMTQMFQIFSRVYSECITLKSQTLTVHTCVSELLACGKRADCVCESGLAHSTALEKMRAL